MATESPEHTADEERPLGSSNEPIPAPSLSALPHFGRFTVLERAGAGAMGVVYGAYDPVLDRRVAIKVLRGAAHDQERARREALALARLSHPNVVQIYDVGEEGGRLFIAMEYVDGLDLGAWLAAKPRDGRVVLDLFLRVGQGLAAAHSQGLIHRDFKPSNVLVGEDGRPRIIDFGLARAAVAGVEGPPSVPLDLSSPLTRTGHLLGTPAYMAPELLDGGPPTPASDQFAFCVALFEALYGQPPFPRDSLPMLRHAMARQAISVPVSDVPIEVASILRRGLAAAPDQRWPSVTALLDALDRVDTHRPDLARGQRMRTLIMVLSMAGPLVVTLDVLLNGPPSSVWVVLGQELALAVVTVSFLLIFRRWFAAQALNRRIRTWLVILTLLRISTLLIGIRLGLQVAQLYAIDAALLTGLLALGGAYIGLSVGSSLGAMCTALLGIFIFPEDAVVIHHVAGLVMVGGLLQREWALRKAQRAGLI